jgi:hypothetical protein
MNGPNQGKSVWKRAREVFEANWAQKREELRDGVSIEQPLPATLGASPDPNGPSYYWISNDTVERGNMTACGASGMSGAGGCS